MLSGEYDRQESSPPRVERGLFRAGGEVPEAHLAGAGQPPAVRRKGDERTAAARHAFLHGDAFEVAQRPAGRRLEDAQGIDAARDQDLSVRGQRQPLDRLAVLETDRPEAQPGTGRQRVAVAVGSRRAHIRFRLGARRNHGGSLVGGFRSAGREPMADRQRYEPAQQ